VLGKAPALTIGALVKEWSAEVADKRAKSRGEQQSKVRLVQAALEELSLAGRPAQDVQAVAGELVEHWEGLAPGTVNRRLCVLKAACKWAWKVKRWMPHNLSPFVALLGGETPRDRVIDAKAITRLLRAMATPEGRAFVALGAYGLMRQGEVMRLDKAAIARGGIRILDWDARIRTVHVVAQLKPHLKAIPLTRHKRTLYAEFEDACTALKLENFVYHDLRRSGATILLNRGVPLEVVSAILGHKDLETTRKIYAHVLPATVRRAMDKGFAAHRPAHRGKPAPRVSR
jgi:integrase